MLTHGRLLDEAVITLVFGQRRAILKADLAAHGNASKDVPTLAPLLATRMG